MRELRIVAINGCLGYGYEVESLEAGIAQRPHFIGGDAGSTDPGPFYLGTGRSLVKDGQVERDLSLALLRARAAGVPLVIGSAGMAGGDPNLEAVRRILVTVACLQDLATVLRSKNAGPFQVTLDLLFDDEAIYRRVLASGVLTAARIGALYGVEAQHVSIIPFDRIRAVKVTLPRRWGSRGSGSPFDRDVYGAQQHGPLAELEIP